MVLVAKAAHVLWTEKWFPFTHLATKSLLTSRKIKKHSSLGVKAR